MTDLYLLLAGATAILIGGVLIVCEAGRSIAWRKAYVEVTDLGLALAHDIAGFKEQLTGVRQETERAVDHLRHKYDEEIVFAETERNKIIDEFQWALGDGLLGADAARMSRILSYEKRPVPKKRPLGGSIGGPSNASQTRGGSLTGKGLAEVFVDETKQPGGDTDG